MCDSYFKTLNYICKKKKFKNFYYQNVLQTRNNYIQVLYIKNCN